MDTVVSYPSVHCVQWGNSNENREFPVAAGLSGGLPDWFLVDASICVRGSIGDRGRVSVLSAHAGPGMVSAVFSMGGEAVAMCSVPFGEFEPYSPYPVVEVGGSGVFGMCAFGDVEPAVSSRPGGFVTMSFPGGLPLEDSCVVEIPDAGLLRFVDDRSGNEATGDVPVSMADGLSASVDNRGDRSVVSFSASYDLASLITHPCYEPFDVEKFVNARRPIKSINGMPVGKGEVVHLVFTTMDKLDRLR